MRQMHQFIHSFVLFIKGILMGSADIIPGVSGGTIALIVGIYERFILALQSINFRFILSFFKGFFDRRYFSVSKKDFFSIDLSFLIPLVLGIFVAFLTLANIVSFALDVYPTYTFAFFFGLIFSSAIYVYLSHQTLLRSWRVFFFASLGFLFSFFLVGLESIQMEHSIVIIFVAGIVSICAMILPGISGAFILLMIGQYTFMLNVLRSLSHFDFESLPYIVSFGLGALIGLMGFSRVLSFLLKKYHMHTLSFVLGLMIGALRKPGAFILDNPQDFGVTMTMIALGIFIVALFSYYELSIKKHHQEANSKINSM